MVVGPKGFQASSELLVLSPIHFKYFSLPPVIGKAMTSGVLHKVKDARVTQSNITESQSEKEKLMDPASRTIEFQQFNHYRRGMIQLKFPTRVTHLLVRVVVIHVICEFAKQSLPGFYHQKDFCICLNLQHRTIIIIINICTNKKPPQ